MHSADQFDGNDMEYTPIKLAFKVLSFCIVLM